MEFHYVLALRKSLIESLMRFYTENPGIKGDGRLGNASLLTYIYMSLLFSILSYKNVSSLFINVNNESYMWFIQPI